MTRKSNECQELETRINQLLDMEQGLNERESISSRLNKGLSEISIKIPSPSKYIGSSSSPSSSSTTSSSGTSSITEGSKKISDKMKSFLSTKVKIPFSHSDSSSNSGDNRDAAEEIPKSKNF